MAERVIMNITNNQGYGADQIRDTVRLGDFLADVQRAVEEYGEDALVVTKESGNSYGARFGSISTWDELFTADEGDDEEDE